MVTAATSSDFRYPVLSLEDAYVWCDLCLSHYENFPVASFFLKSHERRALTAVYAFARCADDFADEGDRPAAERLALLDDWGRRLEACPQGGGPEDPNFWALGDVIRRYGLPLDPFRRLLAAFRQDVTQNRYATFDDVLGYCRNSADPVGELVLRITGAWTPERQKWSDAVCTALQLANFWQDLSVDAQKDRVYIPQDDLARLGKTPALIKFQVDRTRRIFEAGRPLCDEAPRRLRRHLRLVWLGGTRILRKIEDMDYDVWSRRPKLGKLDMPGIVWRWLTWRITYLFITAEPERTHGGV